MKYPNVFLTMLQQMIITTRDIQDGRLKRARVNHTTYKMLYNMVATRIRSLQDVRPPVYKTSWKMPHMIAGRPLFQHSRALNYIRDKLAYGGFDVRIDDKSMIVHVSWESVIKSKRPTLSTDQLRLARQKKDREKDEKDGKSKGGDGVNALEIMANRAKELSERLRY